ncbi:MULTISPECIES: bifunctional aldolase/short-chain dehydrogenase [unclassified Meiothermus]|uniref:bifunctional aldolase/short-chain dehydrogenase n=1 Tax=unclassified Meiothermus TaxID=370471 RepID=UPI000D7BA36E|nr:MULTISPECIES: bifunctional aldolase/short-chain dehydrogenase [unclassified Meiothermus]PZA05741.1 bifunctional rhamnulose-1-phosphate aldolase/short-chain dehydrogenase [Meiothermus sp. Pnk-1]RYM30760.1 bifunctional aldolase/short-chain dehydrogenase [Meiothermus sp. PNK-Is4]
MPQNLWNDAEAPSGEGLAALAYRSRLLGADRSLVNLYGGNTSCKSLEHDHLGRVVEVLWVKGSGSDLADIGENGFAGLKLAEVLPLFAREAMSDEEMVAYLERCTFEPGRPRQSIETLLHAFVPARHVDHTHPDAIISLACSPQGRSLVREIYGERAAWVDYIRPGFTLSKQIGQAVRENPRAECVIMAKHGLVTWGETARECYENTLRIVREAEAYLARQPHARSLRVSPLPEPERKRLVAKLMPTLRGAMGGERPSVLCYDDSPEVLAFVGAEGAQALSQVGAACPDHLVHTKRVPLFLDWTPEQGEQALLERVRAGVQAFAEEYRRYFETHRSEGDRMFPPTPRVILIPGLGMITSGGDAWAAEVSRQLYHRAIQVMGRAQGGFVSLSEAESYAVEYWPLELYKLSLRPPPKALEGRIALVTGAASGIGKAIAHRLAAEGAHVVIADINALGAEAVAAEIRQARGYRKALAVEMDVTDEAAVEAAFERTVLEYGGVDIVVNNAGISASAPIEETSLEMWNRNLGILATGYFLVSRAAFRMWKTQGIGGNLIFIGSKNSVAAGKNAAAYSAAKAAELHLARCLAEEGGAHGIRVNSVLPDAVLSGSSIWNSSWRAERAATYGIREDQLEEFYRARTTLKVSIYPEDVAEAVYFFASPASSKTTGGVLTVDGGVPAAYVR